VNTRQNLPHASYRIAGVSILVIVALVAMAIALVGGGGAAPLLLGDAGPVVRWGLPTAKLLSNLSVSVMLGSLVLALFSLRAGERQYDVALDTASVGAAVFTVTSGVAAFFTFLVSFNPQLSLEREFGAQLGRFLFELPLGQAWVVTVLIGAIVTIMTFAARGWTITLLTTVLAAASLLPMATQGHSGDLEGHVAAVNSILLHTVGAAVWLGGLLLLVVLRTARLRDEPTAPQKTQHQAQQRGKKKADATPLVSVLQRYSSLALVAFIVVGISGLVRSLVAIGAWEGLLTGYGAILLVKTVLLVSLGAFGAWYRLRLIPKIGLGGEKEGKRFWMLVLAELALMGAASGAAAALARTPPPVGEEPPAVRTPAEILTRSKLPPELTLDRWFTQWDIDILWVMAAAFGVVFYLLGVRRLRQRGDTWPIHRTVLWLFGMVMLFWVTCGPMNAYQEYLFSVHMLGHMMLSMALPLLLVSGAPVTLALRAITKRTDGTRGAREWILWGVQSPYSRVLTHPFVAAGVFIVSLWAFYFTDIVRWAVTEHLGHEWMIIHFLITGYLFVLSLIGADPVPYRLPYPGRLITLIGVMAMHAFFGMAIMMQSGLMVAEWFGSMGRTWGPTPMEDQYIGGGIAWSVGEIPTLILAVTVAIQWSRADAKVEKREDRHADRTGDAELIEYNAKLAALAERDS